MANSTHHVYSGGQTSNAVGDAAVNTTAAYAVNFNRGAIGNADDRREYNFRTSSRQKNRKNSAVQKILRQYGK